MAKRGRGMGRWMMVATVATGVLGGACALGPDTAVPPDKPVLLHFRGVEGLVDAVVTGRNEVAHALARDMTAGEGPDGEELGSAAVGSALGFLQIAEDEELADGLAAMATACGTCHAEQAVPPPEPESWSHESLGRVLVDAAIWGREVRVRAEGSDVGRAWSSSEDPEDKLSRAIQACRGCHAEEGLPAGVDPAVVESFCDAPCGGTVTLYRAPSGPVDRLVHSGDLSHCSHVMRSWARLDGTVELSASDEPQSAEVVEAFRAKVDAFMGDRIEAATLMCAEPGEP